MADLPVGLELEDLASLARVEGGAALEGGAVAPRAGVPHLAEEGRERRGHRLTALRLLIPPAPRG